jgi:AraC family transcriptional activator of pyochelin receptor
MERTIFHDAANMAERASVALRRFAERLRATPYEGAAASLYLRAKVMDLIVELVTGLPAPEPADNASTTDHQCAYAARELMMADLNNLPRIETIANQVGLSQRRLSALFKELFGGTPQQCLTQWRLERAKTLLAQGELSVKQVAHMTGYTHVSSFSYAYARHFGEPPSRS